MKENNKPSKVWLISQESDNFDRKMVRPVKRDLLFEYVPGKQTSYPVGYIIEHNPDEDNHIWNEFSDGFSVPTNIVAYATYTGVDISHLEGQLLTIIDASFVDKQQCESIKSLVRNTLWQFNGNQERKVQEMFKSLK